MILTKVQDPSDLLNFRQVCSTWKTTAESLLKETSLSAWKKWSPFIQIDAQVPLQPVMKLGTNYQWSHPSLSSSKKEQTGIIITAFPTSSVEFQPGRVYHQNGPDLKELMMYKKLWRGHGHQLTSVFFTDVVFTFNMLSVALKTMTNLKALGIMRVDLHPNKDNSELVALPRHKKLEHLKVGRCRGDVDVPQLLFNNYNQQLVSLETEVAIKSCPWDSAPFTKLKQLNLTNKLGGPSLPALGESSFANLQYLAIHCSFRVEIFPFPYKFFYQIK